MTHAYGLMFDNNPTVGSVMLERVCVYYCRTYYKAVRGGGRRRVEDMCYSLSPQTFMNMRLLFSIGMPNFVLPNLDSVNHCTSKEISMEIKRYLLVQWLTESSQ